MRRLCLIKAADFPPLGVFGRDISLQDYRRYLGTTQGDVFYDASQGLFPNAFAAIAGSIRAGHTLYLHLPPHYPQGDPDHQRYLAYGEAIETCDNFFNQRLRRLIAAQSTFQAAENSLSALNAEQPLPPFLHPQAQIILGKRGSGKSYFLAQKLNFFTAQGIAPLLISPFADNRQTISQHCQRLPLCLPPDEALRRLPPAQALIIDEAAAIAPKQLLALCQHYPAYTLATTTDGYEGSAQQFLLHTLPALALLPTQIYRLTSNYRYASGDALERLIERIFLFAPPKQTAPQSCEFAAIRQIQRQDLAADETLLASLWRLLSQAHYRNRPEDLKQLLDMPNQALFIAQNDSGECLGVLQIQLETPLETALAQAVIAGQRRPRGRLLMQQLLLKSGNLNWAEQKLARVQRIAVHQNCRRQRIASRLLAAAEAQFADWQFGCVHSASEAVGTFWQNCGYRLQYQAAHTRSRHHGANHLRVKNKEKR